MHTVTRPVAVELRTEARSPLESRIADVGGMLDERLTAVLAEMGPDADGPAQLARTLGVEKVLTSRLLKALRGGDPVAVVHAMPGPEPLRRVLRSARRQGVSQAALDAAADAVAAFEQLIRQDIGDRSALDAIISAWLPEARQEFELRRKQAAFKAISQLRGIMARTNLSTVLLHPSDDGRRLDIVWLTGLIGLQRLRPGAGVKLATRRIVEDNGPRKPMSLDLVAVEGLEGVRLDAFCSTPPPALEVVRAGDVVHYVVADTGYGPKSAVDLIFAEVNLAEMPRFVPRERRRKGYVFSEVSTPVKTQHFDVLVHEDVYPGSEPTLSIHDTAFDGIADINNPARDIDRLDLAESIQPLGMGIDKFRAGDVPRYAEMLRHVCEKLAWPGDRFRGYRCRVDYPLYGTQVSIAFDPPPG